MARLPDKNSFGQAPTPVSNRPVVAYGSSDVNNAIGKVGAQIEQAGAASDAQTDKFSLARANTFLQQKSMEALSALQNDQDYSTIKDRYAQSMQEAKIEAAKSLPSNTARQIFSIEADNHILNGTGTAQGYAKKVEADVKTAGLNDLIKANTELAVNAPDEATRSSAMWNINDGVAGLRDQGIISNVDAQKRREDAADNIAITRFKTLPLPEQVKMLSAAPKGAPKAGATDQDSIINNVFGQEGGFVNDKDDRGKATNYGITKQTLSEYRGKQVTDKEVQDLSKDEAAKIYGKIYADAGVDKVAAPIRDQYFDMVTLHGKAGAAKIMANAEAQSPDGNVTNASLADARQTYIDNIVRNDPSQRKFLKGWTDRTAGFKDNADDVQVAAAQGQDGLPQSANQFPPGELEAASATVEDPAAAFNANDGGLTFPKTGTYVDNIPIEKKVALRESVMKEWQSQIKAGQEMLTKDPAQYAIKYGGATDAESIIATQIKQGINPDAVSLLPNDVAKGITTKLEGAPDVQAFLDANNQLRAQAGGNRNYDIIMKDLVKAGLPQAGRLLMTLDPSTVDANTMDALFQVSKSKDGQIKANAKSMMQVRDSGTKFGDFETQTLDGSKDWFAAKIAGGMAPDQINFFSGTITSLASYYYSKGMSIPDSQAAATNWLTGDVNIKDMNGVKYSLPKDIDDIRVSRGQKPALPSENIGQSINDAVSPLTLPRNLINATATFTPITAQSILKDKINDISPETLHLNKNLAKQGYTQEVYAKEIKDKGGWADLQDATGLKLVDSHGIAVVDISGKPITMTYEDLRKQLNQEKAQRADNGKGFFGNIDEKYGALYSGKRMGEETIKKNGGQFKTDDNGTEYWEPLKGK